ncbi:glucose-1-phosphate adenylyltransferase subunit GlgD [Sporolactobacillus sp. THM7-7]|nr:glucose-1-phosphate adenylyltransferase subunit GlgD [Sporolactobacillus sp. THM7-7]
MKKNNICGILNLTEEKLAAYPLTLYRPVASLPFGCRYRLIDFPLTSMTTAGVETIGVFANESMRSVYDHVRSGKEWGLDSVNGGLFFFSSSTAGSGMNPIHMGKEDIYNYYNNIEFIEKSGAAYVAVMGTRNLCSVDLRAVLRSHIEQGAAITVVYKALDNLSLEDLTLPCMTIGSDGKVKTLVSPSDSDGGKALVNTEIYLMRSDLLAKLIRHAIAAGEPCDLRDVIQQAMIQLPTVGFEYTGYFRSIHSIKSYYDANMDLLNDAHMTALLKGTQIIHTKVKNEAPTYYGRTSIVRNTLAANGCIIKGAVSDSLIFRNVSIEKDASVDRCIIMQGSSIGIGAELQYVILDKQVIIEPFTRLIGSREQPITIEKNSNLSRIVKESESARGKVYHLNER